MRNAAFCVFGVLASGSACSSPKGTTAGTGGGSGGAGGTGGSGAGGTAIAADSGTDTGQPDLAVTDTSTSPPDTSVPVDGAGAPPNDGGVIVLSPVPGPPDDTTSSPLQSANGVSTDPTWMSPVFASDSAGNIIVAAQISPTAAGTRSVLAKYDPTLKQAWSVNAPPGFLISAISADSAGNIFAAGVQPTPSSTSTDAGFIKYLPSGIVDWQRTVGGPVYNEAAQTVSVGPDDSIFGFGTTNGQLPGQPPASDAGEFQVHYGNDGTLLHTIQFSCITTPCLPNPPDVSTSLQIDKEASAYVTFPPVDGHGHANPVLVAKLDSVGNFIWADWDQTTVVSGVGFPFEGDINYALIRGPVYLGLIFAMSPGGTRLYWLVNDVAPTDVASGSGWGIYSVDPSTGKLASVRRFATAGPVTLDPIEGTTWRGNFVYFGSMVATEDSIFLTGIYFENYFGGSNPKPTLGAAFVLRLDVTGNQVWFRAFPALPGSTGPIIVLAGNQDRLVIVADDERGAKRFFTLHASDGTGP